MIPVRTLLLHNGTGLLHEVTGVFPGRPTRYQLRGEQRQSRYRPTDEQVRQNYTLLHDTTRRTTVAKPYVSDNGKEL